MKPEKVVVLCSACESCPTIELFQDQVRIGEGQKVVLSKGQWNDLVEKIERGELGKIK